MIRSFLPVGQGAFYLEQFTLGSKKINVVYDCGSSTALNIVQRQIEDNFQKNEAINAVFISHFDRDHVNGLPHLLQYCKVEKIFFPLITQEFRALIRLGDLIHNPSSAGDFFNVFLTNPFEALNSLDLDNTPQLYQVSENNSEQAWNGIDATLIQSGNNVKDIIFGSQDCSEIAWLYIPFNFRQMERCKKLKDALADKMDKSCSAEELLERVINDSSIIPKIKEAYKEVPGNFNTNSMTLLSASEDTSVIQSLYRANLPCSVCRDYYWTCCNETANGCLYTGDYDASGKQKYKELDHAYCNYFKFVGCVQVPHHGSRHNFNQKLLSIGDCVFYIISAGDRNSYRHPHASVLKEILASRKHPFIVNEYVGSSVHFCINHL